MTEREQGRPMGEGREAGAALARCEREDPVDHRALSRALAGAARTVIPRGPTHGADGEYVPEGCREQKKDLARQYRGAAPVLLRGGAWSTECGAGEGAASRGARASLGRALRLWISLSSSWVRSRAARSFSACA